MPSYEKLAMTSQCGLIQFYDVIIRHSVFELDFLLREFQISCYCHFHLLYSQNHYYQFICNCLIESHVNHSTFVANYKLNFLKKKLCRHASIIVLIYI